MTKEKMERLEKLARKHILLELKAKKLEAELKELEGKQARINSEVVAIQQELKENVIKENSYTSELKIKPKYIINKKKEGEAIEYLEENTELVKKTVQWRSLTSLCEKDDKIAKEVLKKDLVIYEEKIVAKIKSTGPISK